jgi:hypothetical protein
MGAMDSASRFNRNLDDEATAAVLTRPAELMVIPQRLGFSQRRFFVWTRHELKRASRENNTLELRGVDFRVELSQFGSDFSFQVEPGNAF